MTIWICSLAAAPEMAERLKPSRVVSLLSPYDSFPTFSALGKDLHLQVAIHDITADIGDWQAPAQTDAERVIRFVEGWDRAAPMLIHCWAGISRSTATAYITACVHNPDADERAIAEALREASPTATPNRRFVALADQALGRDGRMSAAIEAIGPGYPRWPDIREAEPFALPSRFAA